jgi:hypothetical protein
MNSRRLMPPPGLRTVHGSHLNSHSDNRCIAEGLVGGEGFAVDASLIAADANKQRSVSRAEHKDWHRLREN